MISFSLIVRDCEDTLPITLRSIKPICDDLVVVDTDSKDSTPDIARAFGARVIPFTRQDHPDDFMDIPDEEGNLQESLANFALARNISFDAAKYPWIVWLDGDDELVGLENWADLIRRFSDNQADGVILPYEYSFDEAGRCITLLWRERLLRWEKTWRWQAPVHEFIPGDGRVLATYDQVRVIHHKQRRRRPILKRRNLEILRAKGDRAQARTWFYLGTESAYVGEFDAAIQCLEQYLQMSKEEEETYQALYYLGDLYLSKGRWEAAINNYGKAIVVRPTWRDAYFGMAKAFCSNQMWDRAIFYLDIARRQPEQPSTMLTFNPKHEVIGWIEPAVKAFRAKGQPTAAMGAVQEGLKLDPANPLFQSLHRELVEECNVETGREAGLSVTEFLVRSDRVEDAGKVSNLLRLPETGLVRLVKRATKPAKEDQLLGRDVTPLPLRLGKFDPRVPWVFECLKRNPAWKTIAIPGCGTGVIARILHYNSHHPVEAWDPHPQVAADLCALKEYPNLHFGSRGFRPSVRPLLDPPIVAPDVVILFDVLEYAHDPQEVLNTVRRWLTPGGTVLLSVPKGSHAVSDPAGTGQYRLRTFTTYDLRRLTQTHHLPLMLEADHKQWFCLQTIEPDTRLVRSRRISIVCPPAIEVWNPQSLDQGIGGSEESVIRLSRALAARGHEVRVHCQWEGEDVGEHHAVRYVAGPMLDRADVYVAWRVPELLLQKRLPDAEWLWLWLHDTTEPDRVRAAAPHCDQILVGSQFHAALYPELAHLLAVVRYGVDPREFSPGDLLPRDLAKFVYTSCPTRGLEHLLDVWPQILQEVPQASLHVFYDFVNFDARIAATKGPEKKKLEDIRRTIRGKANQPGVLWRGRVSHAQIAQEMMSAGVFSYPCVAGDTPIDTPRDYTKYPMGIPIKDLVGKKDFLVWSLNTETGQFDLKKMLWCRKTKENAPLLKIVWQDGSSIRLTPDHLLLTYKRGWICAKNLLPGESVVALKKHAQIQVSTGRGAWPYEHRIIAEVLFGKIESGFHVDHIDGNPFNNSPENLQILSKGEHVRKSMTGVPRLPGAIRRSKEGSKLWAKTPEGKASHSDSGRRRSRKFWDNLTPEQRQDFIAQRNVKRNEGYEKWWVSLSPEKKESWAQRSQIRTKRAWDTMTLDEKSHRIEKQKASLKRWWASVSQEERSRLTSNVKERNDGFKRWWNSLSEEEKSVHREANRQASTERANRLSPEQKKAWSDKVHQARWNHKVERIEECENEDVYDMEVEDTHNYVACGVVVHNCSFPEIACISAVKSMSAGCWPVHYDVAALPETIAWGWPSDKDTFVQHCIAAATGEKSEEERQAMQAWAKAVYSWDRVALTWERLMRGV